MPYCMLLFGAIFELHHVDGSLETSSCAKNAPLDVPKIRSSK